ncbi:histone deacetylase complex subunit SAP18-like [Choloepus didactylus]|uniref:histone deacetylase complex subunit SAP18-like n=1 Tax=Choloepus didactylus TaxID=27675 RepID=UPI00189F7004|nr:histone deacetylase complex subunit SAP18-like [Choloepus didactylus]
MVVELCISQEKIKKEPEKPVDGKKICQLLPWFFTTNNGSRHWMDEFSHRNMSSSELQICTWKNATLKELTRKRSLPKSQKEGYTFQFCRGFSDLKRPGYRVKEIGSTISDRKGTDDSLKLQSQMFQIGDYLDIAITPPKRAPPPSGPIRPY